MLLLKNLEIETPFQFQTLQVQLSYALAVFRRHHEKGVWTSENKEKGCVVQIVRPYPQHHCNTHFVGGSLHLHLLAALYFGLRNRVLLSHYLFQDMFNLYQRISLHGLNFSSCH